MNWTIVTIVAAVVGSLVHAYAKPWLQEAAVRKIARDAGEAGADDFGDFTAFRLPTAEELRELPPGTDRFDALVELGSRQTIEAAKALLPDGLGVVEQELHDKEDSVRVTHFLSPTDPFVQEEERRKATVAEALRNGKAMPS